jgi:hypothetical protein
MEDPMTYIPGLKAGAPPFSWTDIVSPASFIIRTSSRMFVRLSGALDFTFLQLPTNPQDGDEMLIKLDADEYRVAVLSAGAAEFDGADYVAFTSSNQYVMTSREALQLKYDIAAARWYVLSAFRLKGPTTERFYLETGFNNGDSVDNYDARADVVQLSTAGTVAFSGFAAPLTGSRVIHVIAKTNQLVMVKHQDTASAPESRIELGNSAPSTLSRAFTLVYGTQNQRWALVGYVP